MKAAALAYARCLSWSVFPVAADGRTPIRHHEWPHGVHSATSELTEIERRWTLHPTANIALACGLSGVFALDVDVKGTNGFASLAMLEKRHGQLPTTWRSQTPSGGAHILFRQPAGRQLRNRVGFAPGLDVRTTGGSICLPPSRRPDGCYRWMAEPGSIPLADVAEWLLELIDPPEPLRPPRRPLDLRARDRVVRYVEAALDGECRSLASMAPSSGRNAKLFQAGCNLGELIGAGLLPEDVAFAELERAAQENGLWREDGPHAVHATIRSGIRRGLLHPRELTS